MFLDFRIHINISSGVKYDIYVKTLTSKGNSEFSQKTIMSTQEMQVTALQKMRNSLGITEITRQISDMDTKFKQRSNAKLV